MANTNGINLRTTYVNVWTWRKDYFKQGISGANSDTYIYGNGSETWKWKTQVTTDSSGTQTSEECLWGNTRGKLGNGVLEVWD